MVSRIDKRFAKFFNFLSLKISIMLTAKPARRLTLMYLANDVIQNSRKKGPEFSKEFLTVLLKAFEHISKYDMHNASMINY